MPTFDFGDPSAVVNSGNPALLLSPFPSLEIFSVVLNPKLKGALVFIGDSIAVFLLRL